MPSERKRRVRRNQRPERYAILVRWDDGREEFVMEDNQVAIFRSRYRAEKWLEFLEMGLDGGRGTVVPHV